MTGNQIGMRLGQIRKEKGISQSALAKITNIHRNTIIRMEIGAGGKLELMEAIARALDVRLSDVMRAVEEKPIEDVRLCRASRKFYMEHMGISRRVAKRLKTAELIQLAHCKDDSARRLLLGVSSTITVPCDWCGKEIGEECLKCGGFGVIVMAQRKAS